jgi:hypothetical protein
MVRKACLRLSTVSDWFEGKPTIENLKMEFDHRQDVKPGATSKVFWDVTANKVS